MLRKVLGKMVVIGRYSLLPILAAIYPILFHYANNIGNLGVLPFTQLGDLFTLLILIAVGVFIFFDLLSRGQDELASLAGLIFIILFHIYGILFEWLRGMDFFQVEHYLFFPFFTLAAIYLSWFIGKSITKKYVKTFWNISITVICSLILFNLIKIVPDEVRKIEASRTRTTNSSAVQASGKYENTPDIYFLIFDEFAGFDAMRGYWKYNEIAAFEDYLKSKGFFIAENSHAAVPSTLPEISSRLNYETVASEDGSTQIFYDLINNNKVMQFLKDRGYSTVVFNGLYYAWSTQQTITADFSYQPAETYTGGYLNNEFEVLVLKNTMVLPFLYNEKQDDPVAARNRSMIFFTSSQLPQLSEVPGPRFVYVHLMFPHAPFLFDSRGKPLDPQYYWNWDYYLGNYIYSLSYIHDLVDNLITSSSPDHPPVIILQSDHGARNGPDSYTKYLENYPEEYRTLIMNALYLPGCDTSSLSQDIDPINTFPVVFNCYFDANLPIK